MKLKIIPIGLVIILMLSITIGAAATVKENNHFEISGASLSADWTLMIYLAGDNDLESNAIDDFLEMASVGSDENVNIVVQLDRSPYYSTSYGDWTSTKRYLITKNMIPDAASAIEDIGEANMGDPQTVVDFISWSFSNYPASKYCFVFWDHGTGWKPKGNQGPRKYVCFDGTSNDALELSEINNALSVVTNSGANKIGLVGFDACLMGMIEVGYEIYQYAEYMTASEETEPVSGWDYQNSLYPLVNNPSMSAEDLGALFVNYYNGYDITLSTVNLGSYVYLGYLVGDLGQSLMVPEYKDEIQTVIQQVESYDDYDFVDLYHFAELITYEISNNDIINKAQSVMYEVNSAVTSEKHSSNHEDSHGISIYFPYYNYKIEYQTLLFAQYTQWDEFLHWYHGGNPNSNPPSKPVIEGPMNGTCGVEYVYSFTSYDVDGDDIYYYVEWGDWSSGEWSQQLSSGTTWEAYHTWLDSGAFIIKAKAMDTNGAESEWSTYTITMPRSRSRGIFEIFLSHFPILQQILQLPIFQKLVNFK